MYKLYFKQAIQMLKQNKFISIISIVGTALAIMMVMTIILADEVKNINAAPEDKRDRMLYLNFQTKSEKEGTSWHGGSIKYDIFKDYISKMSTPEYICPIQKDDNKAMINREGLPDIIKSSLIYTEACFWNIFSFSFIKGRNFTAEEAESGISVAVISESMAKKLFKDIDPIGKDIQVNFFNYKVIGVVKDVSQIFKSASADVWIPYKSRVNYQELNTRTIVLLAKDNKDFQQIADEVRECERKYNSVDEKWELWLKGPLTHKLSNIKTDSRMDSYEESIKIEKRKKIIIFLILILVPAINLSGFSLSRIKKRKEEIGIRKAFGAKNYIILMQVLYENMITSLIGGVIGLTLSYFMVSSMRQWLLNVKDDTVLPGSTMISASVFIAVFIVCLFINLLSAGIPAYKASRMNIIDSLNQKED